MKLLLDTNVFIPLEPGSLADLESGSEVAAKLLSTASLVGATVYLHPKQRKDIEKDKNLTRRDLRLKLLKKYTLIPEPPTPTEALMATLGNPRVGTNSEIDAHLIAALERNLINLLVTEDQGIHKLCARLNLESKCRTVAQALEALRDELPADPTPPPAVRSLLAHQLDETDPIFDSIRGDYPPFDVWLTKCREQHHQCWVIELAGRKHYAGVCIINGENRRLKDAEDPTLKICTFKIADDVLGMKLGELLLHAVFEYAWQNDIATLFVETYRKHLALIQLLTTFGFHEAGAKDDGTGQIEMRKSQHPLANVVVPSAFEFHRLYGPHQIQVDGVRVYHVPIEPRFHAMLFPNLERQKSLLQGTESCGNTIRKAYLCNASIQQLTAGDVLLFYRSHGMKKTTAIGVVEETLRTSDAQELARFARRRTVYEMRDIEAKTSKGPALGILFRYAPILKEPIPLKSMTDAGLVKSHPQSIVPLPLKANSWIRAHLK